MDLILAINTASQEAGIALLKKTETGDWNVVGESAWTAQDRNSERLLPGMQALLSKHDRNWRDLKAIFVVKGPGAYTSLRVGITVANSLAWGLDIPVLSTDVFTLWEHRLSPDQRSTGGYVMMAAGRKRYLVRAIGQSEPEPKTEAEAVKMKKEPIYGEVPEGGADVSFSFGEGVSNLEIDALDRAEGVEPLYTRPPKITPRQPKEKKLKKSIDK